MTGLNLSAFMAQKNALVSFCLPLYTLTPMLDVISHNDWDLPFH